MPFVQCLEAHSVGLPHGAPASQAGAHADTWQVPLAQTWDPQSESAPQELPSLHLAIVVAQGGG